jgi:hypothetical protein
MSEDRFQKIRAKYRGFGLVAYSIAEQKVIAVGDTHRKINKQLEDSEYNIGGSDIIILRCETDEYI